jgi:SAM-dependent methyltransferase
MVNDMRRQPIDRCPTCGAEPDVEVTSLTDLSGRVDGRFHSVVCRCGVRWLNDPISSKDIALAYGDDYYSFGVPRRRGHVVEQLGRFRQLLLTARYRDDSSYLLRTASSLLPGYPPRGRVGTVLDVGCGSGERLVRLAAAGWQCFGIDASEQAVASGKDRGLDVRRADAMALPFRDSSFDAVVMSHSIEHCSKPREAVREAARILKPRGSLVVTTPNAASPIASLLGPSWVNWDAPRHYLVFSDAALCGLLREEQFDIVRVRGSATGWSWAESLRLHALTRHWRGPNQLASLIRMPSTLAALLLNFTRFADEIEVVATRRIGNDSVGRC